ncbi:MAG: sucrase ferredoxin [Microthrixaceae bacterium]
MSDKFQCALAAADRDEPLFATASQVRGWLLVEVRGAWGNDAVHESALGELVPSKWKEQLKRRGLRVVCIRSHLRRNTPGVRLYTCSARCPGAGPSMLWRREIPSLGDVVGATEGLALDVAPGPGWAQELAPLYLVCTNGRHDQCCANLGRPLVRALRESPWAEQFWESSHVGGDRFAANVVALPESVYFGRVDPEVAPKLLEAFERRQLDLQRFRGRTSLTFAEQAVEHFVRREFDIVDIDGVVVGRRDEDGSFPVQVGDRSVAVRIRRRMEIVNDPLTCSGPAQQQVPTFTLHSIA